MSLLKEIAPSDPCDRCGHPSRRHAAAESWSVCSVRQGTDDNGKPKYCPCDGFFGKPVVRLTFDREDF